MTDPVTRQLILKDWRLYREPSSGPVGRGVRCAGDASIEKRRPAVVVGSVWFFIALIMVGMHAAVQSAS